jgi:hypothetical protein
MDFLKKHYEKIVPAVALLALIVSAILLAVRISDLSSELESAPASAPRVPPVPHAALQTYSNAIQALAQPPLWTNVPVKMFDPIPIGPVIVTPPPRATNEFPVILMKVVRLPFKLLFKAYSYDASTNEGYNFQINFQFRKRTFFTRAVRDGIKDHYEDTGYRIVGFMKKSATVNDPSLGGKREKDVSELTVQHAGNNPVVLVLGQEAEEQEPVAQVRCAGAGPIQDYRRGQLIECQRKTYRIVDIVVDSDPKRMVIVNTQTQEQHIIKSQQ